MEYKNNYLKQVIFQCSYNSIPQLKSAISTELTNLCDSISDARLSELKNTNFNIIPNQQVIQEISSRWIFKGNRLQILVQHDTLQIINTSYTNHNEFHKIIDDVFNIFKKIYTPSVSRISLRYINNISFSEGSTYDFENIINESLLKPTLDFKNEGLTRSMGSMVILDDAVGITTNFTYGFFNPEFPNKIVKRFFILDYDCFSTVYAEIESITQIVLNLRDKVNHLFEKSILPGLREKMKLI